MPFKNIEDRIAWGKKYYIANKEKKKKQATEYYYAHHEKRLLQKKLWEERNRDKQREYRKEYWKEYNKGNHLKRKARWTVSNATRDGRLIRPDNCSKCKIKSYVHAHHNDYTKPLEIEWLCHQCHFTKHQRKGV